MQKLAKILAGVDVEPVDNGDSTTDIRAALLERWATVASDPGVGVSSWLKQGANAGLAADPTGIDKTFTRAQDGENLEEQLISDTEFEAHSTAGSAQRRAKNSENLLATTSRSLTSASSSRRAGRVKKRLIPDLEKSGVSRRTRKTHRPLLPAPRRDQGHPGTLVCEGHTVQCLLLDFTDTFWQIPLARAERKNIVGFDGKSLWMYSRSAQGSNGPLTWAGPSSR